MTDKRKPPHPLLLGICARNFLSYGPDTPPLYLENLNVFVGPNGSGKSNLIEALAVMRATPVVPQQTTDADIRGVLRRGGGVEEWIWKGQFLYPATLELEVGNHKGKQSLYHFFSFGGAEFRFYLQDERIEDMAGYENEENPHFYYRFQNGHPELNTARGKTRKVARERIDINLSILAQRRDPDIYPELTYLTEMYERICIYRDWSFGRNTVFRQPQRADMRNDILEEDFSNLGLFLSRLRKTPKAKRAILDRLQDLYEGITDIEPIVEGGSVQLFVSEGDFSIPATRLSDGTLRYLCLLAILCDPSPPPVICIEEPELGLHPDILPKVADLLIDASSRTQLLVTTHSDILVDALSERPECVVVCEKHDGRTQMKRLDQNELKVWLDKYRLGQLWLKGKLGGTRW